MDKVDRKQINELIRKGIVTGDTAFCGPEHVVVDLTNRCNNNCIACWTKSPLLDGSGPDSGWHRQQLSTQVVHQLIEELAALGTKIVRFTGGGEPFLHPDIYELISAVKRQDMFCAVTTSLGMVRSGDVERLIATGVDELSVSLWAADEETYQATHPGKSGERFSEITRVLRAVAARKRKSRLRSLLRLPQGSAPKITLLNVISSVNFAQVEKMYDYAREVGADALYFTVVDPIPDYTDSLLLTQEQRQQVIHACQNILCKNNSLPSRKQLELDNFEGFFNRLHAQGAADGHYDEADINELPCYIGWLFCRVMANGEVVPCCRGVELALGNLNEQGFKEIWFSKKYGRFRKMAKETEKSHPFFSSIGCGKTCDNRMHNEEIQNRLFPNHQS